MHEQAAKTLIKDTFQQPYDLGRFRSFINELLKGYEPREKNIMLTKDFEGSIKSAWRLGKIKDSQDNEIDILAVHLALETSLERARTTQRNFIAKHLSHPDRTKEAALVAFVSPDGKTWRFSLVRKELSLKLNLRGKTKTKTDFSPARRFSFLVGENERTHTAQRQLIELLKSDNRPSLKTLEKAFNIEQVTEEFFEEYRELFNRVHDVIKAYVEKHPATKAHFAEKDIEPADFAKRLLGQIVFLYFLQKKGWLGVPTGKKWGEGSRTFLRDLYRHAESNKQNFFHEYLQPLFYDALNRDHSDNKHYHKLFDSRIPFLNGGLFEPYHDYDWTEQNIKLPNSLFHELGSSLFGDDGKGILDVFDRYNFTVAEDEPLEREVAIDPEMLGKVFEKLLPVKERGKLGTFYTPREIVHYMCQESLIAYLSSHFPALDKTELDDFIRYGDLLMEHDSKILRDGVSETYKDFFLGATIRANLKEIDEALKTVKVCDPAIGSGAFPVGMMSEIVRARKVLAAHMRHERPSYDLKRETIQESLYGVDFDPGAIEIAKLRLWLSLVVDEDNFDEIQALPNLDYKIMQGNSLLQSYEGIKLFEDTLLKQHDHTIRRKAQLQSELKSLETTYKTLQDNSSFAMSPTQKKGLQKEIEHKKKQISALDEAKTQEDAPLFAKASKAVELAERLKKLHHEFFDTDRPKKKKELKAEIETLEWQLIETSLREKNKADKIPEIQKLQRHNVKPYFLWKLHFNEVFAGDNGGFDIVIANPPYAASFDESNKQILSELYPTVPDYESANYFERKGLEIAADGGFICYIIPNTFLVNVNGKKYRNNILQDWQIKNIVNLSNFQVFDSAGVRNCIPFYQKSASGKKHPFEFLEYAENKGIIKRIPLMNSDLEENIGNWLTLFSQESSTRDIIAKIRNSSNPLSDFATVSQGLIPYDKYRGHSEETIKNRIWHSDTKIDETYKKELKGKDIDRYSLRWNGKLWISYGDWLAAPRNPDFFRKPRILIREITNPKILATYTEEEFYNTPSIINLINFSGIEPLVLLGLLNSKLISYFHYETSPKSKKGMFPKILVNDVRQLPVVAPSTKVAQKIAGSVSAILDQKKQNPDADVSALEAAINAEVYKLYHLTDAEIAIIEQAVP